MYRWGKKATLCSVSAHNHRPREIFQQLHIEHPYLHPSCNTPPPVGAMAVEGCNSKQGNTHSTLTHRIDPVHSPFLPHGEQWNLRTAKELLSTACRYASTSAEPEVLTGKPAAPWMGDPPPPQHTHQHGVCLCVLSVYFFRKAPSLMTCILLMA